MATIGKREKTVGLWLDATGGPEPKWIVSRDTYEDGQPADSSTARIFDQDDYEAAEAFALELAERENMAIIKTDLCGRSRRYREAPCAFTFDGGFQAHTTTGDLATIPDQVHGDQAAFDRLPIEVRDRRGETVPAILRGDLYGLGTPGTGDPIVELIEMTTCTLEMQDGQSHERETFEASSWCPECESVECRCEPASVED